MIVRLKECITEWMELLETFQFYDSPIKSYPHARGERDGYRFQFYDSPIKRK